MKDVTFDELLAKRSPESQQRIAQLADEIRLELKLSQLREELEISQQELAKKLNVSQPSIVALEKRGNDIKLSSVKRYIEAMGGKLSLTIELPTGVNRIVNL